MSNKTPWYLGMVALLGLYGAAIFLAANDQADHLAVRASLIVLAAHVLEMPLAFRLLKAKQPDTLRLVGATLLFGGLWWEPARRGIFAVR